jgi:serine/threonine protein kinase
MTQGLPLLAGKYRIERVLGQGGMGVVVAAMHTALDERVAIKLLLPDALANPETVARFQREARAAVRIKSEHVARVTDVGAVDPAALALQPALGIPLAPGAPFMVMEYLEGQDLAAVLRAAGPLSVADAVLYVAQAIEAIAEAHSIGIVHRDLKPSNLFLTRRPDGTPLVKVLDFGISKAAMPGTLDGAVTTTSAVLGSPMYMAPEQMIASREVDSRTDVWALGVVLYQLLTGRGPFNGTTMTELCARILQEPHSPVRASRADVPVEIEAVVSRCLEKDRTRRFASVADLAEALAPFGGQAAALSAERARRLLPRTERVSAVPQTVPNALHPNVPAAPYAATNPSWSATRGRGGAPSGVWFVLALALAGAIGFVAVVVLVFAARAREAHRGVSADTVESPAATAPGTAAPEPHATVAPGSAEPRIVELAPLHAAPTSTSPPPPPRTGSHRPPPGATATHAPPPPARTPRPPPTATAEPKPDIF